MKRKLGRRQLTAFSGQHRRGPFGAISSQRLVVSYQTKRIDCLNWKNNYRQLEKLGINSLRSKLGNYKILKKWFSDATGKTYQNVAEIQETNMGNTPFGEMSDTKAVHLLREDGRWTWVMSKEGVSGARKLK